MTAVDFDWGPLIADLWVHLIEKVPAASAVRDNPDARALVEEVFKGWHHDVLVTSEAGPDFGATISTVKPLPLLEMKRREIVGGDKTKGIAPETIELIDRLIGKPDIECYETSDGKTANSTQVPGVVAQRLGIASAGSSDEAFRLAALEFELRFAQAWPALERLRRAAEKLVEATPEQAGGPVPLTTKLRCSDAMAIAVRAARAWRIAGLPLGCGLIMPCP